MLRRLRWRVAQVAVVLLIAVVLGMGSVTVAAESLPGSPLYPVKRAAERVQLRVTFDPQQRAALRLTLAERRANEIVALAHRGRPVDQITLAVIDQAIQICQQRARLIQQMQRELNRSIQSK